MYWIFSAPGGDFQSVLDEDMVPFEEDVQGFLRQILEALDFIHDRNIAHLDIKVCMYTLEILFIFLFYVFRAPKKMPKSHPNMVHHTVAMLLKTLTPC